MWLSKVRYWIFCVVFLLAGCVSNGFVGVPKLGEEQSVIWHYSCAQSGVLVEYKRLGSNYTAVIEVPDEQDNKKPKVLDRKSETPLVFELDNLHWISEDNEHFTLIKDKKILAERCVGRDVVDKGGIHLKMIQ